MEATATSEIIKIIQESSGFIKTYGGLIGTFIASATALFIAGGGGRWLINKAYKPNLKVTGNIQRYMQALQMWRIAITNEGNDTAKNVQAMVTRFIEGGQDRENFVPMPLAWTHQEEVSIDIHPEQTVYLDIIEHHTNTSDKKANLASPRGHGVPDFRDLKESEQITTLEITFYGNRGRLFKTYIDISWSLGLCFNAKVRGKRWALGINAEGGSDQ